MNKILLIAALVITANLTATETVKQYKQQAVRKSKASAHAVRTGANSGVSVRAISKTETEAPAQIERTFAIIKPDAVEAGVCGDIIKLIELNKFKIFRLKKVQLTRKQAENFYKVHKDKPFFPELINYITSGPVIALALERENAVKEWRNLMGATNPEKAGVGTIRKMFGTNVTRNATHGSDSPENAQIELLFFFPDLQYN